MSCGQCGRCRLRRAGPRRQGGQHPDGAGRMSQRPIHGHRGTDGHPADRDGGHSRRVVELGNVSGDQPVRLRRRRHDDGARVVQRGPERPVDVVVVGSGSGQKNRRHSAQIDRHRKIVPCGLNHRRGGSSPAWHYGTNRSTVAIGWGSTVDSQIGRRRHGYGRRVSAPAHTSADRGPGATRRPRDDRRKPPTPAPRRRSTVSAVKK